MNYTDLRKSKPEMNKKTLTRFVFLDGFVFKISKHNLEPVWIIGSQHPERVQVKVRCDLTILRKNDTKSQQDEWNGANLMYSNL